MADVTLLNAVLLELDEDFFTRFEFQPLNIIDTGMCGEVVLARASEDPKRKLVVKKFSLLTDDTSQRNTAMFDNEVRFMQALKHPFLTTCLLPVKCPDYLAISMPYYQRRTLDYYLGNLGIEISELCVIQVACALRYMHRNNMAHLDVKLDNIFMDDEFNAILGDFGLSVELSAQQQTLPRWKCGGTLGYSAPEHRRAKREDELNPYKMDAYCLGVVLWCLVFEQYADEDTDYYLTARKKDKLPLLIRDMLLRLLQKDLTRRITVTALLERVQRDTIHRHVIKEN